MVVDDERAVLAPFVEAAGGDLIAIASVVSVSREDQPDGVARVGGLECGAVVVVDDVVRWRGDGPDIGGGLPPTQRVADAAEGKELRHEAVHFRRRDQAAGGIVAYTSREAAERAEQRRARATS